MALSPNSKCTCVLAAHATGALVSSYSGADAVMKPEALAVMLTARTCEGDAMARKRYFFATTLRRYCASAEVGHGLPYVVPSPAAHCDTAKEGLR